MMWRERLAACVLAIGLWSLPAASALGASGREPQVQDDPVVVSPELLDCFHRLFQRARGDVGASERGAWLLYVDEATRCLEWPFNAAERMASPGGPPPPNSFAATHTHPEHTKFSPADHRFARTYRMPLYLIHRRGVWKYDPAADREVRILGSDWLQRVRAPRELQTANCKLTDRSGPARNEAEGRQRCFRCSCQAGAQQL
jgi:hypothetical protein